MKKSDIKQGCVYLYGDGSRVKVLTISLKYWLFGPKMVRYAHQSGVWDYITLKNFATSVYAQYTNTENGWR